MKPYYQDESVTIYHGDCRDILPSIGKVDLVLTDPPDGVELRHEGWDYDIPVWLPSAREVADTVIFTTAPLTMWAYPPPDWVLSWHRPASSSRRPDGKFNHWTPILVYGKWECWIDILSLHAIANARAKGFGHPCPKPHKLFEWLVGGTSAQTIVDPFMGSGTTLEAAKLQGRKAIGIEIEERYCEIAANRCRQMVMP